jgi:hypothetical protein
MRLGHWIRLLGFDLHRAAQTLRGFLRWYQNRSQFKKELAGGFKWGEELPMIGEWEQSSGGPGAYFLQDLEVARWLFEDRPVRHVDVGSRIDGFIGSVASFREVEVIDIRPAPFPVERVVFHQLDIMSELPDTWKHATDSLSCLHTVEHFGLGRYGDPINPNGHLKGLEGLKFMVKPGGMFYLSVPVGAERIEFNAHRIFSIPTVASWFQNGWKIEHCTLIDDHNQLIRNPDISGPEAENSHGCHAGVLILAARRGR